MERLNSEITGAVEAAGAQQCSAGQKPGTTASSHLPAVSENAAKDWLLRQADPEAVDLALESSLTSTLGITCSPRTELRFPVAGGYTNEIVGYRISTSVPVNLPAALDKVRTAMVPATPKDAKGWLVLLQAATVQRNTTDASSAVAYAMYSAELCRWPADVAKAVCDRMARGIGRPPGTNWFPTLAEIIQECERLSHRRREMLKALQRRVEVSA